MFYLLAGLAIILLVVFLPVPYVLWVIGIIVGSLMCLYGLWVMFGGPGPRAEPRRGVRWR